LRRAGLRARSVHLKVKFADFRIATRQATLSEPTDDGTQIYRMAQRLLANVEARPVRLTGVHASGLAKAQLALLDAEAQRRSRLNASLDRIADRFGEGAVIPADLLERKR
jgi:nucleotidyltransferase/DNA polymerase involved in DNA repair